MTTGAPPRDAAAAMLDTLEQARRTVGLQVSTLARAVVDPDDTVGWSRLTELGTTSTVRGQESAIGAVSDVLTATLDAAGMVADAVQVPIRAGVLGSGRDVRGMFAATEQVVRARMAAGATFPEARESSATFLTGVAASEPHRIGRDGQLAVGLVDERFARYRRVAEAGACDFCRMLATRGAVYLTAERAGRSRRYHNLCRCHIEMLADPKAIAQSQGLQGDWRNAIRDDQRLIDAGAMTGVASDTRDLMAAMRTSGGWMPGNWSPMTADEIMAKLMPATIDERWAALRARLGSGSTKAKPPTAAFGFTNGNKTVIVQPKLTKAQVAGLIEDFDAAIATMPDDVRTTPVELLVPTGDRKFHSGRVGGYVFHGERRIHINPAVARGTGWSSERDIGHFSPAFAPADDRRYIITHEMGHVVDGLRSDTLAPGGKTPGGISLPPDKKPADEAFWRRQYGLPKPGNPEPIVEVEGHKYGKANIFEGYAEAFAQYRIGGPGSDPIADAYAARYGW